MEKETHLIISDISARTGIEAHVLRYWEKELNLNIPRNELGHRYYLESHVELFRRIHSLKEAGYQLKAIKNVIEGDMPLQGAAAPGPEAPVPSEAKVIVMPGSTALQSQEEKGDKMLRFQELLRDVMIDVLGEYEENTGAKLSNQISERVIKQMDYLFRMQEEMEEEKFKKLDETIRSYQRERQEAASGSEKRRIFRRKKRQE